MVDNDICDNKIDVKLKIHLKVGPCHTECRWVPGVILAKVDGLISLQIAIHRPVMIIGRLKVPLTGYHLQATGNGYIQMNWQAITTNL